MRGRARCLAPRLATIPLPYAGYAQERMWMDASLRSVDCLERTVEAVRWS
jgi:hypothetical protein